MPCTRSTAPRTSITFHGSSLTIYPLRPPLSLRFGPLSGCSSLVIFGRRAVAFGHFWERPDVKEAIHFPRQTLRLIANRLAGQARRFTSVRGEQALRAFLVTLTQRMPTRGYNGRTVDAPQSTRLHYPLEAAKIEAAVRKALPAVKKLEVVKYDAQVERRRGERPGTGGGVYVLAQCAAARRGVKRLWGAPPICRLWFDGRMVFESGEKAELDVAPKQQAAGESLKGRLKRLARQR